MSDAAARRRQRILAAAGNRMAVVSGLAAADGGEEETTQGPAPAAATPPVTAEDAAAAAADAGGESAPSTTSAAVGSSGGSAKARARRLQSRNIVALEGAASTASFSTSSSTTAPEPEKEEGGEEPPTEGAKANVDADASEAAEATATAPSMSLPSLGGAGSSSSGASFTTGGNALRRRFHASKGSVGGEEDLDAAKGESEPATNAPAPHPILAAAQQRSALRRFLDAALATEAGLRFLLVFVAGVAAGLWAVAANAGVVAEGFEQAAANEDAGSAASGPREALDAFVSSSPSSSSSSSMPDYTYGGSGSGGKGVLGWVHGLFLPPAFDCWPLPVAALLLHVGAAFLAPVLLRLKSGAGAQSKRAAILARMPAADGTVPPPPPPVNAGASEKKSDSFIETMAQQMGFGPLLDLFRFAQAAWQDVLLFSFAFLASLSLASASERVFVALMSAAMPDEAAGGEL